MNCFLSSLRNLEITGLDHEIFEIIPGLNFTNSHSEKVKLLVPRVTAAIGYVEEHHILKSKNLLFYNYDEEDFRDFDNNTFLIVILVWLEELLKNSWLIKDNCIDCDYAALGRNINGNESTWSSNALTSKRTMADGSIIPITFSKDELLELKQLHEKIENYLCDKDSLSTAFMLSKNFSRIGRSLSFIKLARSSTNLAYKISNYCSALETLLTTDTSELAHKLSERVAYFLVEEFPDKLKTFNAVKSAYGIRSKLTHGDSLSQNQIEKLPEISLNCDCFLRAIITKAFASEELLLTLDGTNEKVDNYFNNLIFS